MSNDMAPECLNHKENRNLQVRLDYMFLYRSEGKAKIIRVIETWTNTKYAEWFKRVTENQAQGSEPSEEDLWVTMSYDEFSLFVYGTLKHDTIKKQVDELVSLGHIRRRTHPTLPYGPPQYLLNRKMLQEALDTLEIPPNLFDLFPSFVPPKKKQTPQEQYPGGGGNNTGGDPLTIPRGTGEISPPSNNTTKNTKNQTKNGDTSDVSLSAKASEKPTQSLSISSEKKISAIKDPAGNTEEKKPPRQSRKPVAPKVAPSDVDGYLDVFDDLYHEVGGDAEMGYGRTKTDREAITTLLKNNLNPKTPRFVTPAKLRLVYLSLHKKPGDEKFRWADNMTIKAVCNNYAKEAMALTAEAKQREQAKQFSAHAPRRTVSGMQSLPV